MVNILIDEITTAKRFDTSVLKKGAVVRLTNKFVKGEGRTEFGIITLSDSKVVQLQIIDSERTVTATIEDYLEPLVFPYTFTISSMKEAFTWEEPPVEVEEEDFEPVEG